MSPPDIDLALIAPELVLAATAILVLVLDLFLDASRRWVLPWTALAGIGGALAVTWSAGAGGVGFSGMLRVDALSTLLRTIVLAGGALSVLIAADYLRRTGLENGEYYALVLIGALGASLLASAVNLLLIFLAMETVALSLCVLVCFDRTNPRCQEAGLKYLLLMALSTAIFLYGVALVFGSTGGLSLEAVRGVLAATGGSPPPMFSIGLGLVVLGLGFEAAVVPLHAWAPDVYEGAPIPSTAFLSVVAKTAALAVFVRLFWPGLPAVGREWRQILGIVAALTMIVGNLGALFQTDIKRLLAYSSIAHAGYLLVGIAAGNDAGTAAVVFYLAVYALMNLAAFGVVVLLHRAGTEASALDHYRGLAAHAPWPALALTISMVSLAGFPPTGGFFAKLYLFTAAVQAGQTWVAVIGVLTSVIAAYYYLRIPYLMYAGERTEAVEVAVQAMPRVAAAAGAAGVLLLGVLPGWLFDRAIAAAAAAARMGRLAP